MAATVSPDALERLGRLKSDGYSVDATEHMVALAAQHSAEIVVVRHGSDALREHGQVAALLRW